MTTQILSNVSDAEKVKMMYVEFYQNANHTRKNSSTLDLKKKSKGKVKDKHKLYEVEKGSNKLKNCACRS